MPVTCLQHAYSEVQTLGQFPGLQCLQLSINLRAATMPSLGMDYMAAPNAYRATTSGHRPQGISHAPSVYSWSWTSVELTCLEDASIWA